ncbi:unnamed protein product [Trifolium pratense]|uniref:Uncharacterized protein n=1 Tax=Trifolium pratense TaxID=57577 RepID=A0ACB0LUJ1_TRIPR|nr:unnamed protein product [Trifolium pratense]
MIMGQLPLSLPIQHQHMNHHLTQPNLADDLPPSVIDSLPLFTYSSNYRRSFAVTAADCVDWLSRFRKQ